MDLKYGKLIFHMPIGCGQYWFPNPLTPSITIYNASQYPMVGNVLFIDFSVGYTGIVRSAIWIKNQLLRSSDIHGIGIEDNEKIHPTSNISVHTNIIHVVENVTLWCNQERNSSAKAGTRHPENLYIYVPCWTQLLWCIWIMLTIIN